MNKHTNRLAGESSPYLLQHAHNPVDWFPWGEEALQKAQQEDKPILVSIGYAACHWCHVMEKESFEDESTAAIMNEHFVNIKIDREERPDLDHIYMDAVQAMTGSGGWPLNVFLMPDGKPFYGGTYFPPQRAFNRPSWKETLLSIHAAYTEKKHEIEAQAYNLTEHIARSSAIGQAGTEDAGLFTKENIDTAARKLLQSADKEWGGFGKAPKFPQTFSIIFLLRYHHLTGNKETLDQALLSLDKMIDGGIYDQVGGGFARYATDTEWLVPHFEKMLYDNALILSALSEAYQLTKNKLYKDIMDETISFIEREMMHDNGLFYSALDADSEGVEGKFYVWSYDEIANLLNEDAGIFCRYYDVTPGGNWEHTNILRVKERLTAFAQREDIPESELAFLLQRGREILLAERSNRVRPLLDDKILLGWNALMNTALCKVYAATGNERYRQLAVNNMNALLVHLAATGEAIFRHTWKDGKAKFPAFLDDLAFLAQSLLALQEVTADTSWLLKAETVAGHILARFADPESELFFYTPDDQTDVIVRKKEIYDGATPSANAVMAENLYHLGVLLGKNEWKEKAVKMTGALGNLVIKYPGSFGFWASMMTEFTYGIREIAITGPGYTQHLKEILQLYIPNRVLMAGAGEADFPLLAGKERGGETNIWLCQNYSCQAPVRTAGELIRLIDNSPAGN